MSFTVKPIKKGIVRISTDGEMPQNYLERYGIINVPKCDGTADAEVCENKITLPGGRTLEFSVRPKNDDKDWSGEIDYLLEKFKNKIPESRIEGRPEEVLPPDYKLLEGRESEKKFGISFKIDDDERFFGLGEAGRDRVELRGDCIKTGRCISLMRFPFPLYTAIKTGDFSLPLKTGILLILTTGKRGISPLPATLTYLTFIFCTVSQ